jgi:hypothetical protein
MSLGAIVDGLARREHQTNSWDGLSKGQVPSDVLQKYFERLFTLVDPNGDGQAEAADVAPFLRRSGVAVATLGEVRKLSLAINDQF